MEKVRFVFFGTADIAVTTLQTLSKANISPSLIVTAPDRPAGRGMRLNPPPVKIWADRRGIKTVQPEQFDELFMQELRSQNAEVSLLVAYGKILPAEILGMAPHGVLNLHPSLLPKYRGPSPIQSAILAGDQKTGVTIIRLDEEMDHGPIIAQETIKLFGQEMASELAESMGRIGGGLFKHILEKIGNGEELEFTEQNHVLASFSRKIKKEDGELLQTDTDLEKWRKYRAFTPWPSVFYFEGGKRVKVTEAIFHNDQFIVRKIIHAGGAEINVG